MASQVAHTVVLVRHGESTWNKDNRFTGWVDVELSEKGHAEAKQAGVWLKEKGVQFDVAYTSVLKRAIQTLWHVLEETDQVWLPVHRRWRLNERMYGALQGLNKSETAAKHGEDQVCLSISVSYSFTRSHQRAARALPFLRKLSSHVQLVAARLGPLLHPDSIFGLGSSRSSQYSSPQGENPRLLLPLLGF